jgi:hypothetical protein
MLTARFVVLFFVAATAQAQTSVAPHPSDGKQGNNAVRPTAPEPNPQKPGRPQANSVSPPASQGSNEYFVEVDQLPSFCLAITPAMDSIPVGPETACGEGQFRVQAQNASEIAKALGSDADYHVVPVGTDKVAIYRKAKKAPSFGSSHPRLEALEDSIAILARPSLKYFKILRVPAGTSKEIAPLVSALNPIGITAEAVGNDKIVLKGTSLPDDRTLTDLQVRIRSLGWQKPSAQPTQRLFYLDADKTVKSFSANDSGGKSDGSSGSDKSGGNAKTAGLPAPPSVAVTVTATGSEQAENKNPDSQSDGTTTSGSDPQDAKNPPAPGTAKVSQNTIKASPGGPSPLSMQAVTDTLVYSNSDGGDENILERTRLMTMLDLPRPEILLNLLSFQASSNDYRVVNDESEAVRLAVAHHSEVLQNAIENGWEHLSTEMKTKDSTFWNRKFYDYVTQKFVFEPILSGGPASKNGSIDGNDALPFSGWQRNRWGWCDSATYCLGYAHAFEPLRPTFTNILLAVIAADDSARIARETIKVMSGDCTVVRSQSSNDCPANTKAIDSTPLNSEQNRKDRKTTEGFRQCIGNAAADLKQKLVQENGDDADLQREVGDCELLDRVALMHQVSEHQAETLQLYCFKRQAMQSFAEDKDKYATTPVGLLRAAVADFLFNYKMATQFPHDFVPYDLSQSAQQLNTEFNPLILSFNRDVAAFTQHLQAELQCDERQLEPSHWFGGQNKTFLNDSLITVRGISGVESIVDTVSQSYFDATKPPNLTDLVKSVSDAEKNIPGVLSGNLTANEASVLVGALNSVQPATAKIGRQLTLDITPHSLAGASSAELDVKLTNQDSADPTLFISGKSGEDDLSRVAKHNTNTRVRVESLKLFEVSSLSAILQRPRSRFPLLPPFLEVPYFGSFIGYPLKGATEYHRSTAVVSAVIVPTAADLAFGIDFGADRVCERADPEYGVRCHRVNSADDLQGLPFRSYHKAMMQCFATSEKTAYTGLLSLSRSERADPKAPPPKKDVCDFNFDDVPPAD